MKKLSLTLFFTLLSLNSFATGDIECFDPSVVLVGPCAEGLNLYQHKGACSQNLITQFYCSEREMTNIKLTEEEVMAPFPAVEGYQRIFLAENGRGLIAREGVAKNCLNARVLYGQDKQSVDEANATGMEIGIAYELIEFDCND